MAGVVEGQREIKKFSYSEKIQSAEEQFASLRQQSLGRGWYLVFIGLLGTVMAVDAMRSNGIKPHDFVMTPILLVSIAYGVWEIVRSLDTGPPFGF